MVFAFEPRSLLSGFGQWVLDPAHETIGTGGYIVAGHSPMASMGIMAIMGAAGADAGFLRDGRGTFSLPLQSK